MSARVTAVFRPMLDADREFVVSGWSSSLRTSRWAGMISMVRWADVMHAEIKGILARPSTSVIVAEEPGETIDDVRAWLYGFIAIRTDLAMPYVYYVYVKHAFRRARRLGLPDGYARQLFAAAGIDPAAPFSYGCRTSASEAIAADLREPDGTIIPGTGKIPRAEWDPIPARYEHPHERDRDQEARRQGARAAGPRRAHQDPPLPHRR